MKHPRLRSKMIQGCEGHHGSLWGHSQFGEREINNATYLTALRFVESEDCLPPRPKKMLKRMQRSGQMLKIRHLPGGERKGKAAAILEIAK